MRDEKSSMLFISSNNWSDCGKSQGLAAKAATFYNSGKVSNAMKKIINCFAAALPMLVAHIAAAEILHTHNGVDTASLDPHRVSGNWKNRIAGDLF